MIPESNLAGLLTQSVSEHYSCFAGPRIAPHTLKRAHQRVLAQKKVALNQAEI